MRPEAGVGEREPTTTKPAVLLLVGRRRHSVGVSAQVQYKCVVFIENTREVSRDEMESELTRDNFLNSQFSIVCPSRSGESCNIYGEEGGEQSDNLNQQGTGERASNLHISQHEPQMDIQIPTNRAAASAGTL